MPVSTPEIKVNSVRAMGGEVELVGESYQEAQVRALDVTAAYSPQAVCTHTDQGSFM